MKKKRLITSALPYVNNIPHLGNIIGCVLSADVFARYCRMAGYETLYICGNDEYGTTTETKALQEKLTPKELCDKYHKIHKEIYDWFKIDFDSFGRTSDPKQTEIVQDIFNKLNDNGYIARDILVQPFCEHDKMFLADRYVEGTCPHCQYEAAKGDQCEHCGKLLNAEELKEPKCTVCGNSPVFQETKHLFLDLTKLMPILEKWIDETAEKGHWSHNALSITKGWLDQGLLKRCITRDLKWGVRVPVEEYSDKVFYVWFDAPIGYISITASSVDNWEEWWKNPDNVDLYQFMGKDNIPFHTVIFPSSLLGSGDNWTMLKAISSTEYLNYEDCKFSKSRGTGVFGDHAKETGIDADLFRYYLLRNRPEKNDTQFFWMDFMEKVNGEVIANYANLVNRVLQFVERFFDGEVPAIPISEGSFLQEHDLKAKSKEIIEQFEGLELKKALLSTLEICSTGNKYFQDSQPWALVKTDKEKAGDVIGSLVGFIKDVSILLWPYIPGAVEKVFGMLNLDKKKIETTYIGEYDELSGSHIGKPEVLFKKIDKKIVEKLRDRFSGKECVEEEKEPTDEEIFSKICLKVGKIIEIKRHPEADKLYIEKIDMGGGEVRQIISGLVPYYTEEELLGKKIVLVYNLKPVELRGTLSEGMLLAAETKKRDIVEVLSPDCEVGEYVTIDGAKPAMEEVTIDIFKKIKLKVHDYKIVFRGKELKAAGKTISVEKVEKGKVG